MASQDERIEKEERIDDIDRELSLHTAELKTLSVEHATSNAEELISEKNQQWEKEWQAEQQARANRAQIVLSTPSNGSQTISQNDVTRQHAEELEKWIAQCHEFRGMVVPSTKERKEHLLSQVDALHAEKAKLLANLHDPTLLPEVEESNDVKNARLIADMQQMRKQINKHKQTEKQQKERISELEARVEQRAGELSQLRAKKAVSKEPRKKDEPKKEEVNASAGKEDDSIRKRTSEEVDKVYEDCIKVRADNQILIEVIMLAAGKEGPGGAEENENKALQAARYRVIEGRKALILARCGVLTLNAMGKKKSKEFVKVFKSDMSGIEDKLNELHGKIVGAHGVHKSTSKGATDPFSGFAELLGAMQSQGETVSLTAQLYKTRKDAASSQLQLLWFREENIRLDAQRSVAQSNSDHREGQNHGMRHPYRIGKMIRRGLNQQAKQYVDSEGRYHTIRGFEVEQWIIEERNIAAHEGDFLADHEARHACGDDEEEQDFKDLYGFGDGEHDMDELAKAAASRMLMAALDMRGTMIIYYMNTEQSVNPKDDEEFMQLQRLLLDRWYSLKKSGTAKAAELFDKDEEVVEWVRSCKAITELRVKAEKYRKSKNLAQSRK